MSKAAKYLETRMAQHSGAEAELWSRVEGLYSRKSVVFSVQS